MAFNIKDPDADRLLRELAATTGESLTDAAKRAFEERLRRAESAVESDRASRRARLWAIADRADHEPTYDARAADDIVGYDEHGLPL